jgi:RimJ/RimL family protein N-acetyltransferase
MIETARLILRPWRDDEVAPFVAINNEPEVVEWMSALTLEEGAARLDRYNRSWFEHGFGRMAAERKSDGVLLGSIGIVHAFETLPIAGQPEVGWRLTRAAWGQGYAIEGARAAVADAFARCGLDRVLAMINAGNARSQATARRIGMARAPELDFENADFPVGHRFRPTLIFSIAKP